MINDLPNCLQKVLSICFADDTTLYLRGPVGTFTRLYMKRDLENINNWFKANKLKLNEEKSNFMIFSKDGLSRDNIELTINNKQIERVYNTRFLGIILDHTLDWKLHFKHLK